MNLSELVIRQQSTLDAKQVEQFRAIFVDSFPASERGDFDELVNDIARGGRRLFAATIGKNFVGFGVTLQLVPTNVHVLEYLAVGQAMRDRGIGEKLLRTTGQELRVKLHAAAIILEVEPDDEGAGRRTATAPAAHRILSKDRREDGRLRGENYRAPNLAGPGTVPFLLMWLPLADQADVPTGAKLKDCIIALYTQSYDLSPDDPLVTATLKGLTC